MKKSIFIVTVILCLLAGFGAYKVFRAPAFRVVLPQRGPAVQAVYATGSVEPGVMIPLSPKTGGRLAEMKADEGESVKKGDVLARLEDTALQNTIAELSARATLAESDYGRKSDLLNRGLTSQESFDAAKAEMEAAKASLSRAVSQAEDMKLIAPEDGTVIRRDGEIGQMVQGGEPIFFLSCCASLRITAEVDEEDIPDVKPGQKVFIRADAFPGQVFEAKLDSITPQGNSATRSYRVRIGLPPDTPLLIGMTAEVNIVLREEKNALLLPSSTLGDGKVQVVDRGNVVTVKEVKAGAKGAEKTEILSGIREGDRILDPYSPDVAEGQKIGVVLGK